MKVNSTDLQNNFGKYLHMTAHEDIIITKNSRPVAILKSYVGEKSGQSVGEVDTVHESSVIYNYQHKKMTYEAYLKLVENSEERYEYIDGELYLMSSPKTAHQSVLMELYIIFHTYFKGKKCIPMVAPYDIRLKGSKTDINVVQPDLMVICDLDEKLGEDDYYYGTPTLIVEILSSSTRSKDFIKKLELYMVSGVKEYWIVDPMSKEIYGYQFKDEDIAFNQTYRVGEVLKSYTYEDLIVSLEDVFIR